MGNFLVPIAGDFAGTLLQAGKNSLVNMLGGKSADQKQAEYDLSAATNEIEKALDINSLAFRAGWTSQAQALEIYDALWGRLVQVADLARPFTAAQAVRTIGDRDYGGKWAYIWRGTFRDERILGIPEDQMSEGWVVPEWRWDVDLSTFKYGGSPSPLLPSITPQEVATSTPEASGAGPSGGARGILPWAAIAGGLWWLFR